MAFVANPSGGYLQVKNNFSSECQTNLAIKWEVLCLFGVKKDIFGESDKVEDPMHASRLPFSYQFFPLQLMARSLLPTYNRFS